MRSSAAIGCAFLLAICLEKLLGALTALAALTPILQVFSKARVQMRTLKPRRTGIGQAKIENPKRPEKCLHP